MPVDSKHPEYIKREKQWKRSRDVIAGSDAVKDKGVEYLPQLNGQKTAAYDAYRQRALFFAATSRSVKGFVGALFRKPPALVYPESIEPKLTYFSVDGLNVDEFAMNLSAEVFGPGRSGLLVDADKDGANKYVTKYQAEDVVNWETLRIDGVDQAILVVLRESYSDVVDEFSSETKTQYRVLRLGRENANAENATYFQDVYRQTKSSSGSNEWAIVPDMHVVPSVAGVSFSYIPFVFVNSTNLLTTTTEPPLLEMVDVNLSHYRTSADLEHGAHYTALPTAWVAGFDEKTVLKIGSATAWITKNVNAKAGFLEFTGQGLDSLRNLKKDKEANMASIGARMLEAPKAAAESTESNRMRLSGENATLITISKTVSNAMTRVLRYIAQWEGIQETELKDISYTLNTDFVSTRMSPQELKEITAAFMGGNMSQDTYLYNLQQGEIIPPDVDLEEEKERIEMEAESMDEPDHVIPVEKNFNFKKDEDGNVSGTIA